MTIILDNGHGRETAGKRSPVWDDGRQLYEFGFNRDIVQRVAKKLHEKRIPYRILVPEFTDITIGERCRRVNKIHSETGGKCFLVSVHANAGGGTGWECHIYTEKSKSKDYAIIFADCAKIMFLNWKIRQPLPNQPYWISNFQILRDTLCPAVLTENFFMDTEKDCQFILSETGRNLIAEMHFSVIKKIVN